MTLWFNRYFKINKFSHNLFQINSKFNVFELVIQGKGGETGEKGPRGATGPVVSIYKYICHICVFS